ncbi:hypothetical protein H696_04255 [Fonticula alba]|uniref:Uncharacterized protein n=1 Tax=Fonticula alba TaxID=691883 RepID=A0A058Z5N5_FONAL|nr:hypothetical protein H696_04255 [Fonticula alba]KCV68837.1 hypothetical protein H696_04255 [Fonticula alba]|eukprot:XP_009496408.1 hypothetical protein H696_04255 [Fonticula alba]
MASLFSLGLARPALARLGPPTGLSATTAALCKYPPRAAYSTDSSDSPGGKARGRRTRPAPPTSQAALLPRAQPAHDRMLRLHERHGRIQRTELERLVTEASERAAQQMADAASEAIREEERRSQQLAHDAVAAALAEAELEAARARLRAAATAATQQQQQQHGAPVPEGGPAPEAGAMVAPQPATRARVPLWLSSAKNSLNERTHFVPATFDPAAGDHRHHLPQYNSDGVLNPRGLPDGYIPTLQELVDLLRFEGGQDVVVLDTTWRASSLHHLIVATGQSPRHLRSLAEAASQALRYSHGRYRATHSVSLDEDAGPGAGPRLVRDPPPPAPIEGKPADGWMTVDTGALMLSFMSPSYRQYYDLETLWTGMDVDDWVPEFRQRSLEDGPAE